MKTFSASDAKREFGEVLLKAQKEPVKINKNGKPVAVVVSIEDFNQMQQSKEKQLMIDIQQGLNDVVQGNVQDAETVFKNLFDRMNA